MSVICYNLKKKNLFEVWFYTMFFIILYMFIALGQRLTTPGDKILKSTETSFLSLRSFAASLKKISLKSDFIPFFHAFIHVYSPRAGAHNPLGTKFWCQQEHLVTSVICCKFQKYLFEIWFYTIFFMILYIYIAPDGPQGTKFWCQ